MDIDKALEKKAQHLLKNKQYNTWEKLLHQRATGRHIGDFIYGANDGIITTFTVVAGASGANLGNIVIIILGFANILSDGISMGASNFLGRKSERDFALAQEKKENWEIDNLRELEVEEIKEIYQNKGFKGKDLERAVSIITSDKKVWVDTMMKDELGIIIEKEDSAKYHGLATFASFVVTGLVPLLPYLIPNLPNRFFLSAALGAATLFTVGSLRSLITTVTWLRGGLEMLIVGGTTAIVAYAIGALLSKLI